MEKSLLRKVEDAAARLGYGAVYLHVEAQNQGALRFYDRQVIKKNEFNL